MNKKVSVFKGKYYDNLLQASKDAYKYPNRFYNFFVSSEFFQILKLEDEVKYEKIMELRNLDLINDVYTFLVADILNPFNKLSYQHFQFDTYQDIGKQILQFGPTIDVYLKDLLYYHLISFYMENCAEDKKYPDIYSLIKRKEEAAKINVNSAYWELGFELSNSYDLIYEGKVFKTPAEFFKYISDISDFINFSSTFLENGYVLTWLKYKGHSYTVSRFISLINVADQLDENYKKEYAKKLIEKLKLEENVK